MAIESNGVRGVAAEGIAAAIMALLLAGCGEPAAPPAADAVEPAVADTSAQNALELMVFDCGRIRLPTIVDFGLEDSQTDVRTLFVPCYLVRHPQGDLLWDAGLPPVFAGGEWKPDSTGADHLLEAPISAQLPSVGIEVDDVELIAFSHFHYDHAGDGNAFLGAELLVQRVEQEVAFGEDAGVAFFLKEFYGDLAETPMRLLDGDHDVFGDGSVRIISAPGHTPGHQVLLVDLPETGKVLLSGDLYHFDVSRELRAVPHFNTDAEATRASMDRIDALLEAEGATLWLEHSLAFHDGLKLAPERYR